MILMVTALNELGDIERAVEAGTDDFLEQAGQQARAAQARRKHAQAAPRDRRSRTAAAVHRPDGRRRRPAPLALALRLHGRGLAASLAIARVDWQPVRIARRAAHLRIRGPREKPGFAPICTSFRTRMSAMPRTIVVVPCYNEAKRLNLRAIQEFGRRCETAELLFVNDGSRDETLELIEHLHRNNPRRFSFLHLAKNGGKAEAVRQGILMALRSGGDYVGFWDADLATPLADIEPFCRVLDAQAAGRSGDRHADAAVGSQDRARSRPAIGSAGCLPTPPRWPWACESSTRSAAPSCFASRRTLAALFEQPFMTRWIFDVEIFARMKQARRARQPAAAGRGDLRIPARRLARRGGQHAQVA